MALFKINKGNEANLPSKMTEGYAYFCPDTGGFFIDVKNSSGALERKKLSAEYAEKLRYNNGVSEIEIDLAEIITASNYANKIGVATTSKNGLMSSTAMSKLEDIEEGANKTVVDSSLSGSSTNPVQNKVIYTELNKKGDMLKSVYDTDGDGIVDNAEKVNGFTVGTNVPADAKFTDTVYTLPSAGTSLGGVKSGGDVNISDGVITIKDDSHNHIISNIDGLQEALDDKETSGAAESALTSAKAYTDTEVAEAVEAIEVSIAELSETVDAKADSSIVTAHTGNKSNPHGVTLSQLNVTATAAELNVLDGITATTEELNYVDGATSNIQTQINSKASETDLKAHTDSKSNPHGVTAAQVGADTKGSAAAVQTNLDAVDDKVDGHIEDEAIHVTTTNKSNWNTAHTHSQAAHARTDATKVADSTTNGNILINGTETNVYTHPGSGVTAGTYKSVTVNAQGHITAGTNPTTLAGYGITDAESKGAASSALASAKQYTDTVAGGKADTDHDHDADYDAKGAASSALASAKAYADSAANTAATNVKNDLLNGAGAAYDTLKELGDLIDDNTDAIDALEAVAAGKADKTHSHAISDVTDLQTTLDGKAAKSHGTHVSYSTTAPVMDGTAAAGSASTVARSDHKHPTDTSRAAKTDFDAHTGNTTAHITSTERSNWNAAKTHADSAHAPSNAQPNQNAFSNIKVGTTTVAADTTTDTVEFVGSNVTITPDATNDKVTFTVANGSTSAKGVVQLTNSTSSTSTTTAATPNSVKSAYDLANTAKTNAATAQTRADAAYTLAEGKVDSLSDLGITATAAELNHVDGVTSGVQAQLDGKQATITGAATTITGSNLTASRALVSNSSGKVAVSAVTSTELGYLDGVTSNVQTQLDAKLDKAGGTLTGDLALEAGTSGTPSITFQRGTSNDAYTDWRMQDNGGVLKFASRSGSETFTDRITMHETGKIVATTFEGALSGNATTASSAAKLTGLTASRALVSDSSGNATVSAVTSTELGYLDGVTSGIQAQLDSKSGTGHTHAAGDITSGTLSSSRLPTVPETKGGTGQTSLINSANALMNALEAGDRDPVDTSCVITQGVGDYSNKFYRRPISYIWNYIKGKTDPLYATKATATTSANGLMSATDKAKVHYTNVAYGTCATAAATAAKVIEISGNSNWVLEPGSLIVVKFTYTNSASNPTFNVNNTGAKSVLYNTSVLTTSSLNRAGYANRYCEYMYDGTQFVFVGWSLDSDSTYSQASLGQGYGTCSTAEATTAKVVTLSSYSLQTNGIVSVKFTYAVPASATMNINSKGAKAIFSRGAAITAGKIKAGDIATFIYDGTQYHLLCVDRDENTTYSAAGSSLGLVKSGGDVTISSGTITVNDDSHNHVISNVDNLQTTLDSKVDKSGGTMTGDLIFTTNGIKYAAGENDVTLLKAYDANGSYGYSLKYKGSGTNNNNTLVVESDNQGGTPFNAVTMYQDGTTTFAKAITASGGITGSLSGNATSATKATQDASGNVITSTYATKTELNGKASTSVATTSANGLMSSSDKSKLDGIASGANKTTVDSSLSSTSTNPVQNKVINTALAGKADLDSNGKVPTSQLPSYVDDVLEYTAKANFPTTGETGKIYIDTSTNKTYRWSGSTYAEISASLAIGTTSSTAAAGNHGHNAATTSAAGFMSSTDKSKLDGIAAGATANTGTITEVKANGTSIATSGSANIPAASTSAYGVTKLSSSTSSTSTSLAATASAVKAAYDLANSKAGTSVASTSANGLMSSSDKSKLDGIATGAEVNQNAFSNVVVGSTTIAADSKTDTLTLAGSNVTITPDATNDKVTIGITKDNVTAALGYTPPTTNTTYSVATTSANGLMSSTDKSKLDGIATGANKTTVDSSLSSTSTNPVQNKVINSALAGKAPTTHSHSSLVETTAGELSWTGDHFLSSSNRPNPKIHFGADILYRYHTPSGAYYPILDGGNCQSYCVDLSSNQTVGGNKVFTGTTATMVLHTYNPMYINNGTDNAKSTSLYTNDSNVFAITSSAGSMTFNGSTVALKSDIPSNTTYTLSEPNEDGVFYLTGSDGSSVKLGETGFAAGTNTTATGGYAAAFGHRSAASGQYAFAAGYSAKATGKSSTALGHGTTAGEYQLTAGRFNTVSAGPTSGADTSGSLVVVGNGTSSNTPANAFRVATDGTVYGVGAYRTTGADYAEYFEWVDGNPDNEDRRGYFVTLDGDKIRKANADDIYILGVISALPSTVGDTHSENWQGKYLTDIYGGMIVEVVDVEETVETDEFGNETVIPAHTEHRWVLNPDYDPEQEYISREYRKEWDAVGLLGKLVVNDDGTCEVNGFCKVDDDGKATASDIITRYRVMNRIDDTHIRIMFSSM